MAGKSSQPVQRDEIEPKPPLVELEDILVSWMEASERGKGRHRGVVLVNTAAIYEALDLLRVGIILTGNPSFIKDE